MGKAKKSLFGIIAGKGSLSTAEYMLIALCHPEYGYYATNSPMGRSGDFVTAPEISPVFGEVIGATFSCIWLDKMYKREFSLLELGGGRGKLINDIANTIKKTEAGNYMREMFIVDVNPDVDKRSAFSNLSKDDDSPIFVVANEFFDAMPSYQFFRENGEWKEIRIFQDGSDFVLGATKPQSAVFSEVLTSFDDKEGDFIVEKSPASEIIMAELAHKIKKRGGVALIIDYGSYGFSFKNTMRGIYKGNFSDPMKFFGDTDLSCDVQFNVLAEISQRYGLNMSLFCQREFLINAGINQRSRMLDKKFNTSVFCKAASRLIDNSGMGKFLVLSISSENMEDYFPPSLI